MTHDQGPSTTPLLAPEWRPKITAHLTPEEWDLLYLHYIEGFDTSALAAALQLRPDLLEGPEGRLQDAERHLLEAYARCQPPGAILASCTPAELVWQLFPPPPVALPGDFTARVLAQGARLRQARQRHDAEKPGFLEHVTASMRSVLTPLWESLAWHPPFAGEPVTASQTSRRTERFPSPYGHIQATCEWRAASSFQPATLWLTWQARLMRQGEIWVRFVSRDDSTVQLSEEFCLGSALRGTMKWSTSTLGFDPTQVPWSLVLFLTEPQG